MKGRIHSFQSLGTVDGPGVRTVLFMQGCPLRCPYCHNPDTWDALGGEETDSADIAGKVLRYKSYFGADGGITVSGGEPLLQAEFVYSLFKKLKREGVGTALDTSGILTGEKVEKLLTVTDIALLDIKFSSDGKYQQYIGESLGKPLMFLSLCQKNGVRVIIRQVITEGVNDAEEEILALRTLLEPYSCVEKIELLPFRKLCSEKYEGMGIPFPFGDRPETSAETIERLSALLR